MLVVLLALAVRMDTAGLLGTAALAARPVLAAHRERHHLGILEPVEPVARREHLHPGIRAPEELEERKECRLPGIPEPEEKRQEGESRIEMPEAAKADSEVQPAETAEETFIQ